MQHSSVLCEVCRAPGIILGELYGKKRAFPVHDLDGAACPSPLPDLKETWKTVYSRV
jgi:hypothetical protein